jgi:hypothetical protein
MTLLHKVVIVSSRLQLDNMVGIRKGGSRVRGAGQWNSADDCLITCMGRMGFSKGGRAGDSGIQLLTPTHHGFRRPHVRPFILTHATQASLSIRQTTDRTHMTRWLAQTHICPHTTHRTKAGGGGCRKTSVNKMDT